MTNITKEVTRKMPRIMASVKSVESMRHRLRRLFSSSAVIGSKSSVVSMCRELRFPHDETDVKNAPHLLSLLVSDEDDDECEIDADAWEWLFFFLL